MRPVLTDAETVLTAVDNGKSAMLMFAVVIVMQWSVAICPKVVYLLRHLILFVIDAKLLTRVSTRGWCQEYSNS
jgi:hypothetical protein